MRAAAKLRYDIAAEYFFLGALLLSSGGCVAVSASSWNSTAEYTCLQPNWMVSCKISFGYLFSGSVYHDTTTGMSCVEGTSCATDVLSERIQCQTFNGESPRYEECKIPQCSSLPLCSGELDAMDGVPVSGGVAVVSTPAQLVAAARSVLIEEIVLTRDMELSDSDFNGIPLFIKPGRHLVLNKQGSAVLYIARKRDLPILLVVSGAEVTSYRTIQRGDPLDGTLFVFERNGNFTFVDSEIVMDTCSMVSAYSQKLHVMQTLSAMGATLTGTIRDGSLRLAINSTDWIQGLGVVYREDPEKNFTGSLRYINSTIHCVPTDIQLPSPPFTTNSLVDVSPPGILTPPPSSASESDIAVLIPVIGICAAVVVVVAMSAAYRRYARSKSPSQDVAQEHALTEAEENTFAVNPEEYDSWVQKIDKTLDPGDVPSTSHMCQTISNVIDKVNQLAMDKCSTRIHGVTDFEMVSSMVAVNMEVERRVEQEAALSKVDAAVVPADASAGRDSRMSNVVKLPEMSVQASEDLKAGVIINGYEHVRELGSGSHGKVFLVQVVATGEKLTMKIPKASAVQPVVQEAYLLAMLKHPNIVGHKETFVSNGQLIVVTEWCKYGDLSSIMKRSKLINFSEAFIRSTLFQLAYGVAHMHSHGVAHRDIKPENIFITDNGVVKLGDLGSGRVILNTCETFSGTPLFMAPEIICGEAYTKECDIYSLGSVVYMLCTGYAAHGSAKSLLHLKGLQEQGVDLSSIRGRYSAELIQAIDQMMLPEASRPTANDILRWDWLRQHPSCGPGSQASPLDVTMVIHKEVLARIPTETVAANSTIFSCGFIGNPARDV